MRAVLAALAGVAAAALVPMTTACSSAQSPVPTCTSVDRLALVAQAVPSASYLPCVAPLPAGWRASGFEAASGRVRFTLASDRAPGHPVRVALLPSCSVAGATPTTPRGPGVRTYIVLRSIAPRYAGVLEDVFAGGCVTYDFDFQRGPHIPLMEEFEGAVTLYPRHQLAIEVHDRLGVPLG